MHYNADLIVLDEPTAALGVAEVRKVIDFVRRIKQSGRACIYIEHNLAHVHEVADRLVVLDRGRIVSQIIPRDMTVSELTRISDRPAAQGVRGRQRMVERSSVSILQRVEALPIIVVFALLLALFMYTAPVVFLAPFIYTTFLSTLPPLILLATGLTFVIGAGEIDLCFPAIISFSGFVFAVLFKEYDLGWIAVLAGLASGVLVGFVNGVIIAKIGIPSFMTTLATQFFWAGMATVLSGGKSYALRGAEESSVWQWIVGRPFASVTGVPLAAGGVDSGAVDGDHRRLSLAHPHPPPLRRAHAIHWRFQRRLARRRHRRRPREDQDLHLDGFSRRLRRNLADAGEQELLRQSGAGISLDRDRFGPHRRHIDLRRPGDGPRHGVWLLHHRHDRGGARRLGPHRARGSERCRASSSSSRSSSTCMRTNRSAGERSSPICGRFEDSAVRVLPKKEGFADRGGPKHEQGETNMRLANLTSGWAPRRRLATISRAGLGRRSDRQGPGDVHANGRQPRRRRDARPSDRSARKPPKRSAWT